MLRGFSRISRSIKYTKTHEWLRPTQSGSVRVGISRYAQEQLGEVVYVELPSEGKTFSRNASFATLESVKAVGEVFCPLTDAKVVAVNKTLKETPGLVNSDPEGEGWIVELAAEKPLPEDLMDEAQYKEHSSH